VGFALSIGRLDLAGALLGNVVNLRAVILVGPDVGARVV
jgi:hypothetical protein